MPRAPKGPRLYRRKDEGVYIIRGTGFSDRRTGTTDARLAENALAQNIAEKANATIHPIPQRSL